MLGKLFVMWLLLSVLIGFVTDGAITTGVAMVLSGVGVAGFALLTIVTAHRSRVRATDALRSSGLLVIDRMGGVEFEDRLAVLFADFGYSVTRTPTSGDYGADLILQRPGERVAVQAKCVARPVGVSALQEVLGAKAFYDCDSAIVVTNRSFTPQAQEFARRTGVGLWDRGRLQDALLEAR